MAAKKKSEPVKVDLVPEPNHMGMRMRLTGTSPLIMHAWAEKAIQEMLDKQMKKAKNTKPARNPDEEYEHSLYYLRPPEKEGEMLEMGSVADWTGVPMDKRRFCFPANAVKSCLVDACSFVDNLTKVQARGTVFVEAPVVEIFGKPQKRADMVVIGMGTKTQRFRGYFPHWHTEFDLVFNADILSESMIFNLFRHAGFGVGLGEWRPQRDGIFGRFQPKIVKAPWKIELKELPEEPEEPRQAG